MQYLPFRGYGRSSHKQVMIQFSGKRHLKNNRHDSLPLTPPHPWVCFKPSVYPFSGQMADIVRRSRGRVTTQVQDNRIRTRHLRNRRLPSTRTAAVTIGSHNRPISAHTVIKRLRERGIRARCPYVGPVLTRRHRQARLQWCHAHRRWLDRQWNQVLFSDESRFTLEKADGRVRVYRRA